MSGPARRNRIAAGWICAWLAAIAPGCRQVMNEEPRYNALAESDFFPDRQAARAPVEGTVARGHLHADRAFYSGISGDAPVARIPFPVTRQVLERGQERFNIFCSPCHGRLGDGQGMIVKRGLRGPPSYHIARLREAPDGHFFDVITNGYGAMYSYASRVPPRDRWAIIAYIRALQLSQAAPLAAVPPEERRKLEAQP